jgi:hypothetical protein
MEAGWIDGIKEAGTEAYRNDGMAAHWELEWTFWAASAVPPTFDYSGTIKANHSRLIPGTNNAE